MRLYFVLRQRISRRLNATHAPPLQFNPRTTLSGNHRPVNIYSIRYVPIAYVHKSLISVHWSHTAENQKQTFKEHLDPQSAESEVWCFDGRTRSERQRAVDQLQNAKHTNRSTPTPCRTKGHDIIWRCLCLLAPVPKPSPHAHEKAFYHFLHFPITFSADTA